MQIIQIRLKRMSSVLNDGYFKYELKMFVLAQNMPIYKYKSQIQSKSLFKVVNKLMALKSLELLKPEAGTVYRHDH